MMVFAALVSARPGLQRDMEILEQGARLLDANSDGFIDQNEFPGNLPSNVWRSTMAILDKNRDGSLSVAEYLESAKQQLSKPGADFDSQIDAGLAYLDTNGDGFLDRREVPGNLDPVQWSQMMRVADKNNDGRLSFNEFHDLSNQDRQGGAGGEDSDSQMDAQLGYLDANGDGFLSRAEIPGNIQPSAWNQIMSLADENHDGKLSFEEFRRISNTVRDGNVPHTTETPGTTDGGPPGSASAFAVRIWDVLSRAMDRNGDGTLTQTEFISGWQWNNLHRLLELGLTVLDNNDDGLLEWREVHGGAVSEHVWNAMMNAGDKNHDGRLSFEELENVSKSLETVMKMIMG